MRKQSLILLMLGLLLSVVLPSVVEGGSSDFQNGTIRGVGIGLLVLSVILRRKGRHQRGV